MDDIAVENTGTAAGGEKATCASIERRIEFLTLAIEEVQQTNRFLDTKASLIAAFVSSLLVVVLTILIDTEKIEAIQALLLQIPLGYLVLLIVYMAVYAVALTAQVLITLRVIFPHEFPEKHVDLGDYMPRRLFFLFKVDRNGKMQPSVPDYSALLNQMSEDDIINEYVYELEKLSYIRKVKSDRLMRSFRILGGLVVGMAVLGILVVVGTFL
jgi:hypothetical protein